MLMSWFIAWLAAIVAFLVLDGLWLGVVAKSFYADRMGDLLRPSIQVAPAAGFYLCYALGLVFLAVRPGLPEAPLLGSVALHGAVVGFLAYGTYNMTALAVVRDWPSALSFVDLAWGTLLSASVAVVASLALRAFA